MQEGFILLHRKMTDWEWYKKPKTAHLFRHCLLKANYTDKKWRDITIKRGQFVTSRSKLAFETGLSEQEVRTALKNLISTSDLTSQASASNTIITVVNYDHYQKDNQQTRRKITTTNNINNKESIDIYNTHTKEKSVCEKISSEDMKILRKYAKENGARNIKPYVNKLIENGGYIDILKEEKSRMEKEKQRAQRYEIKSEVPPEKNEEPPADIQILRDNLKFIKPKEEKKNG